MAFCHWLLVGSFCFLESIRGGRYPHTIYKNRLLILYSQKIKSGKKGDQGAKLLIFLFLGVGVHHVHRGGCFSDPFQVCKYFGAPGVFK